MRIAEKRMPAAVVGVLFAALLVVVMTLGSHSAVADPSGPVPNPGHAWTEIQGHGDDAYTVYVSTQNKEAFEVRVDNARALRLEPGTSPNVIGGYMDNDVTDTARGATIGGGGATGSANRVTDGYGVVGGGANNQAGDNAGNTADAMMATVAGGSGNTASGEQSTIGGGVSNAASGLRATVGGGSNNAATGTRATVGGGRSNVASDNYATVGGGYGNEVAAQFATIAGGGRSTPADPNTRNRVFDDYGTIGGGGDNEVGIDDANTASQTYATVGGGESNTAGAYGATVAGGVSNDALNSWSTVGGGAGNDAAHQYTTVAGGRENMASGSQSTVGGGYSNEAIQFYATVGGGWDNVASEWAATVGGGRDNVASQYYATVGGGYDNWAAAQYTTIAGGGRSDPGDPASRNLVTDDYGTIGGGGNNQAGDDAGLTTDRTYATVGGGYDNMASGEYATVPGGSVNWAQGDYSFAAGRGANANARGCFVWGDSTSGDVSDLQCTFVDRFVARASGGVYLYTNSTLTTGNYISAGTSGWNDVSDREVKDNFTPVDGQEVVAALAEVPLTTWKFKAEDDSIRHMGPMAQDLYDAFGLGDDERHINTLDADGVSLAAIQGLYELSQEQDARIDEQQAQIDALKAELAALQGGAPVVREAPAQAGSESLLSSMMPTGWLLLAGLFVLGGLVVVQRRLAGGR